MMKIIQKRFLIKENGLSSIENLEPILVRHNLGSLGAFTRPEKVRWLHSGDHVPCCSDFYDRLSMMRLQCMKAIGQGPHTVITSSRQTSWLPHTFAHDVIDSIDLQYLWKNTNLDPFGSYWKSMETVWNRNFAKTFETLSNLPKPHKHRWKCHWVINWTRALGLSTVNPGHSCWALNVKRSLTRVKTNQPYVQSVKC